MSQPEERPGLPALGAELWDLLLRYVKQETVDPVKALGRFVTFGVAGSLFVGVGLVLLALALLRALQTQMRTFYGDLNWIPYLVVAVGALLVLGLTGLRILHGKPR
jgi:Putative Actinobacterial Holin-X, holin superfamily III